MLRKAVACLWDLRIPAQRQLARAACAQKVKADYVVARDVKGFRESRIPHGAASQFMEYVKETLNIEYDINDF